MNNLTKKIDKIITNNKFIFCLLGAALSTFSLIYEYNSWSRYNDMKYVFLFISITYLYVKFAEVQLEIGKKEKLCFLVLSAFFAVSWVIGRIIVFADGYRTVEHKFVVVLMQLIGFFMLFKMVVPIIYARVLKYSNQSDYNIKPLYFLMVIVIGILPYIIFFYPAVSFWDGQRQLNYFFGVWEWTNHDPAFSTFLIGGLEWIGRNILNDNFGLFLYNLLILIYSLVIFYQVEKFLNKVQSPKWLKIFTMLYFAFLPIIRAYSITICKDTSYAITVLWLTILMMNIYYKTQREENIAFRDFVALFFCELLICNFRNDGIYVVILSIIGLLIFVKGKAKKSILLAIGIVMVIFHMWYGNVLLPMLNIQEGSVREALSVPLQQTALYMREYPDQITLEEREVLEDIFEADLEVVAESYNPVLSDPVKNLLIYSPTKEQLMQYFSVWFKQFLRHPKVYVRAYLHNYYGYIYPDQTGDEYGFYWFEPNENCNTGYFDFYYIDGLQKGRDLLAQIPDKIMKTPIIASFYCPGFYTWILAFCVVILFAKKRTGIACMTPLLGVLIICCLSPVNCRIRYILPIIFALPVFLAFTIWGMRKSEEERLCK